MQKKVSHFASLLPKRGPKAFEAFIKTLMETDHVSIATYKLQLCVFFFKFLMHCKEKKIMYNENVLGILIMT